MKVRPTIEDTHSHVSGWQVPRAGIPAKNWQTGDCQNICLLSWPLWYGRCSPVTDGRSHGGWASLPVVLTNSSRYIVYLKRYAGTHIGLQCRRKRCRTFPHTYTCHPPKRENGFSWHFSNKTLLNLCIVLKLALSDSSLQILPKPFQSRFPWWVSANSLRCSPGKLAVQIHLCCGQYDRHMGLLALEHVKTQSVRQTDVCYQ